MRSALNFLRGRVTVVLTGAEPENFLNLCAQAGVLFWGVERRDPFTLALTTTWKQSRRLDDVAQRAQCTLVREKEQGLPAFLRRFRRRYALAAGALVCMLGLCILSRFVWTIDIQGNETVSDAEILTELRRWGVKIGTYTPSVQSREISNRVLLALDDLSFLSINFHGTRAEIIVREKTFLPKLVDDETPTHVVAVANGVITRLEPRMGQALFKEGDAVLEGEVIISGIVDIPEPEYSEVDLGTYSVHAQGRVVAQTWRTLEAEIPLTAPVKDYTGKEEHALTLRLLGKRLKIFGNGGISFSEYDRITETTNWTLPSGRRLPFGLEWETNREYVTQTQPIQEDEAVEMLKTQLLIYLEETMDEGEIQKTDFVVSKRDGFLSVALVAECTEQIGKVVPVEDNGGPIEDPPVTGGAQ